MTNSASAPLRFVVLLTAVAVALLLLLSGVGGASTAPRDAAATVQPQVSHLVAPGDTLWDIAAGFTPPGDDVRDTIHDIRAANGLATSEILVGDVLVIPVEF